MTTPFLKNKTVEKRLAAIAVTQRSLGVVYDREVRKLKSKSADIRSRCKHEHVRYIPDAAGGSDSWWCCQVCGYESRMKIEANPQRAKEVQNQQSCSRGQ